MRIALAQVNSTVGDLAENAELIIARAREAQSLGAVVVVFPELVVSGYPPEDLLLKDHFLVDCRQTLADVARACPDIVAVVGAPLEEDGAVYNAAAILTGGEVAGWYRKIWLPNYGVFDEKRYFTAGERVTVAGLDGVGVGITICEDIWEAHGPAEAAAAAGADVVVNLSMSPYHLGKGRERETMLSHRALEARAFVCYANGVGGQDELVFDGQSLVFNAEGRLVARAAQFEEELLVADLGINWVATSRRTESCWETAGRQSTVAEPGRSDARGPELWPAELVKVELPRWASRAGAAQGDRDKPALRAPSGVCESLSAEAEVYSALCLGVRDYAAKNGFHGVVLGISGGIDSALTVCIAADALGSDRVNAVSMPSRYSSAGTRSDAREIAERLGVHYHEIPIEDVYGSYLESLRAYLADSAPGVTEQNIQARIRGNFLMALSNKFGWLVLTTGNKSEMAVGYATLYGDMAGGFAVLKDVPKTLVYQLAEYRNSLVSDAGPIPESTIRRAPSAELAPDQTDQEVLPPYEILDRIIEAYVVRDESVEEIVETGIGRAEVVRVAAMIDGNEYKRRQAVPGVRITPKAFGKDRRLPITNRYRG